MANNSVLKAGDVREIKGQSSSANPSVTVFQKLLFQAHRDGNDGNSVKMYCASLGDNKDPDSWTNHHPNGDWKTSAAPSLAVYKGRMFMAWRSGGDNGHLYYAWMGPDNKWTDKDRKVYTDGKDLVTATAPALVNFMSVDGQEQLYMFYVAVPKKAGDAASIMWTSLAKEEPKKKTDRWTLALSPGLGGMTTRFTPSLAVYGNQLYIAFLDVNSMVQVATMSNDGTDGIAAKFISPANGKSAQAPSVFTNNGGLYLVWSSADPATPYTLTSRLEDGKWSAAEPIFTNKNGEASKSKNGVPSFNENFRTGLYGVWRDGKDKNKLKYTNFSGMKINHVFVLMLENRSFDHMLGHSGIKGLDSLAGKSNWMDGKEYKVTDTAPYRMNVDPGHEFDDAYQQLCGSKAGKFVPGPYPGPGVNMDNSGFVFNYVHSESKGEGKAKNNYDDIMKGYNPKRVPILTQLAKKFAVCDHWYSSLPGPTAPNRFFSLAATSGGLDASPSQDQMLDWIGVIDKQGKIQAEIVAAAAVVIPVGAPLLPLSLFAAWAGAKFRKLVHEGRVTCGVQFENGSIFGRIKYPKSQIYSDGSGTKMGTIPMSMCMSEVRFYQPSLLKTFYKDIKKEDYSAAFTLIEPNYGNVSGDFSGGSSQHPIDDVSAGEKLIKDVYEAIRNSPHWEDSVLIITYDEHGGFYDHIAPPVATPPGDKDKYKNKLNQHGFRFDRLGVRVPAVIVSPWIDEGKLDSTQYDHSSIAATLTALFGMQPLTDRDRAAHAVTHLLTRKEMRTDCPVNLGDISTEKDEKAKQPQGLAAPKKTAISPNSPLPPSGNQMVFLFNALKIQLERYPERAGPIIERFAAIRTRKEAAQFIRDAVDVYRAYKRAN